jgi:hypothetical protein
MVLLIVWKRMLFVEEWLEMGMGVGVGGSGSGGDEVETGFEGLVESG